MALTTALLRRILRLGPGPITDVSSGPYPFTNAVDALHTAVQQA